MCVEVHPPSVRRLRSSGVAAAPRGSHPRAARGLACCALPASGCEAQPLARARGARPRRRLAVALVRRVRRAPTRLAGVTATREEECTPVHSRAARIRNGVQSTSGVWDRASRQLDLINGVAIGPNADDSSRERFDAHAKSASCSLARALDIERRRGCRSALPSNAGHCARCGRHLQHCCAAHRHSRSPIAVPSKAQVLGVSSREEPLAESGRPRGRRAQGGDDGLEFESLGADKPRSAANNGA